MVDSNSLTEGSDELISIYDKNFNLIEVNENSLRTFNLTKQQLVGKNLCDLIPDFRDSDRHKLYLDVIRTGESAVYDEFRIHPKYGNQIFLLKISKYGDGIKLAGVDITNPTHPTGIRWLIIRGMERQKLIDYIKRKDKFYDLVNFNDFSIPQLQAIVLRIDNKIVSDRKKKKY